MQGDCTPYLAAVDCEIATYCVTGDPRGRGDIPAHATRRSHNARAGYRHVLEDDRRDALAEQPEGPPEAVPEEGRRRQPRRAPVGHVRPGGGEHRVSGGSVRRVSRT